MVAESALLVQGTILSGSVLIIALGYWRFTSFEGRLSATDAICAVLTLGAGVLAVQGRPSTTIAAAAVV